MFCLFLSFINSLLLTFNKSSFIRNKDEMVYASLKEFILEFCLLIILGFMGFLGQ